MPEKFPKNGQRTLSEAIKEHFELVGIQPGTVIIKGKQVDFRTITLEQAEKLDANGCKYLKKISPKGVTTTGKEKK